MQIQLENACREIKEFSELLAYNGLNLVSQENIKQIEMFLQHASQLRLFRLASSLRYLHVELNRFIMHQPAFNVERYVFYLNNCWLLSQAFLSGKMATDERKKRHLAEICGDMSEPVDIDELELRLAGLEKVFLEGALFGLVFHFFPLRQDLKGDVIKLSFLQQPKGVNNPDALLGMNIPGTNPSLQFHKLLKKDMMLRKVKYLPRECHVLLDTSGKTQFHLARSGADEEDPFPLQLFDLHEANQASILQQIASSEVTPFDTTVFLAGYAYVKKVQVLARRKEGHDQGNYQTAVHVFDLEHDKPFPLLVRIPDKPVNAALVENLTTACKDKDIIDGVFGKLSIERGNLCLFPLALVTSGKVMFPAIAGNFKINNKDILQQLYQQKK